MKRLDTVVQTLKENGVKIEQRTMQFHVKPKILGHIIDAKGLHPQKDKIQAMQKVSRPENFKELRNFLGGV